MLILLKNKSGTCLTVVAEYSTVDDRLRALCGISRHTASSENYFVDSTYHEITKINVTESLITNMKRQKMYFLMEAQAKKL